MALYKGEDKIKDIYLGDVPIFKVYAGEEFCGFFTFSHENLISNSDLLIDSDSNNVPDGFEYADATDISLTNGIAKFTATAKSGCFVSRIRILILLVISIIIMRKLRHLIVVFICMCFFLLLHIIIAEMELLNTFR